MMNKQEVLSILEQYGLSATKSLGQNFLCNEDVIERILELAEISDQTHVLEIGPGIGALSENAVKSAKKYVAVEIDTTFQPRLEAVIDAFGGRVIYKDYLAFDASELEESERPEVVISNLPYYVMTPIMLKVMADFPYLRKMVYMVEEEAEARIFAKVGTKQYGPLAVLTDLRGKKSKCFTVDRGSFVPSPNTTSAVITIECEQGGHWNKEWIRFVESAFALRRKTLVNSLSSEGFKKEDVTAALAEIGKPANVRAEQLEPADFIEIYDFLNGKDGE